jgi:Leucine Rich repeat
MSQQLWLEQLRQNASCKLNHSDLIGNTDAFVDALKNSSTLKSLSCNFDTYDKDFAKTTFSRAIAAALKVNSSLTFLKLCYNSIDNEGAIAIADALKVNSSLTFLYLDNNSIKQEGAIAIADALKVNSSLTSLNLSDNLIDDEGAIAIADALKVNSSLTSLDLGDNSIDNEGAIAIADALQMNTTLELLYLSENSVDQEGAISIAKALTHNPLLIFYCDYEFHGLDEFKDTFHNLQGLLNILIGKEGAQVLGIAFQITSRCLKFGSKYPNYGTDEMNESDERIESDERYEMDENDESY